MELTEIKSEALTEIRVRPLERSEEVRYQEQVPQHHYLGALAKIGETVWHVAIWRELWVAQLSVSAAALKCGVRDRMCFQLLHHWIGCSPSGAFWFIEGLPRGERIFPGRQATTPHARYDNRAMLVNPRRPTREAKPILEVRQVFTR